MLGLTCPIRLLTAQTSILGIEMAERWVPISGIPPYPGIPRVPAFPVSRHSPCPGIKMTGLKAHGPVGQSSQSPQSSSEDFCYQPWNFIPGRSGQWDSIPDIFPYPGIPRHSSCPGISPYPGIKMAGLKAHGPVGQFLRSPQPSSEGFGNQPWNFIPGRSGPLTDHLYPSRPLLRGQS